MINYTCDLCGEPCDDMIFKLPMATAYVGLKSESCHFVPMDINLCDKCRDTIYETMKATMLLNGKYKDIEYFNEIAMFKYSSE